VFEIKLYSRHGQSAAHQLIFAALGPFSGMRKSNIDLLLQEIWPKGSRRPKKICSAEIITLSLLF